LILDTSAILAHLLDEPGAEELENAIASDPVRLMSAANVLEAALVIESRHGEAGGRELDIFLHKVGVEIVSVSPDQIDVARGAYRRYGRGRHAAQLNFGDCFAYALSKTAAEPLLFVGDDFARTDVERVL
jgi:ribonuclease VapC